MTDDSRVLGGRTGDAGTGAQMAHGKEYARATGTLAGIWRVELQPAQHEFEQIEPALEV